MMTYAVFVKFPGDKMAQRMAGDGTSTRRRVHAAMFDSLERAEQVATECQGYLDAHHPGSKAWAGRF